MIWVLVILGLLLVGLGFMAGQRRSGKGDARRGAQGQVEMDPDRPLTLDDALDILSRPVEHAGAGRPVRDRYQSGLLTGLGTGLLITGLALAVAPASLLPQRAPSPVPGPSGETATPAPGGGAVTTPAPAPAPGQPPAPAVVSFVVAPGDLPGDIAAKLKSAGLIADPGTFLARLTERGADTQLKAGTFRIPAGASIDQVIDLLTA